ncbi:MAG: rod shape-determining protein MreC [Kiritimatiellia bacterium]
MVSKKWVYGLVLVVGMVILLNLPALLTTRAKRAMRDGFFPFQRLSSSLGGRVRNIFAVLSDAQAALAREQHLLEQIASLQAELASCRTLEKENVHMRAMLGLSERKKLRVVAARVVSRGDLTGWWQTIRLDKGEVDGIATNMPVINADGLIGKTIEVARHSCEVLLISDPNCRVPCKPNRSAGGFGIARGSAGLTRTKANLTMMTPLYPLQVDYLSGGGAIMPGDEVVTSGIDGVYPEGIVLGRVTRVSTDSSGLYRTADLTPGVDLQNLRYAFVVTEYAVGVSVGNDRVPDTQEKSSGGK